MHIILLKLGGSLITDKKKPYTTRPEVIAQVITEIKEAYEDNPDLHLILGNGAGSFAHQSAQIYGTIDGFTDEKGRLGACAVHQDAAKLNSILVEECLKQQVPVFSLQPSAIVLSENKTAADLWFQSLDALIQNNIIPFLYGDVIMDHTIGATIFSTDTLFRIVAEYLCTQNHTVTIIHAGDYDGVLDSEGQVIAEITPAHFDTIQNHLSTSTAVDVTGGMRLKVQEMLTLTQKGIRSSILNGTVTGTIRSALQGAPIGTSIIP